MKPLSIILCAVLAACAADTSEPEPTSESESSQQYDHGAYNVAHEYWSVMIEEARTCEEECVVRLRYYPNENGIGESQGPVCIRDNGDFCGLDICKSSCNFDSYTSVYLCGAPVTCVWAGQDPGPEPQLEDFAQ